MKRKAPQKGKKPYRAPRLVRYGDLRRLTGTTAKGGAKSDGSNPPTKA